MNELEMWVDDLLGTFKENPSSEAMTLIESCGKCCAERNNHLEGILKLREVAAGCKTRSEYVKFLQKHIPVKIAEAKDGIVMHLGKEKCTCTLAPKIFKNFDALCNCTCGHEKALWSLFFGKSVEVEVLESFLRAGKDCVIKINF